MNMNSSIKNNEIPIIVILLHLNEKGHTFVKAELVILASMLKINLLINFVSDHLLLRMDNILSLYTQDRLESLSQQKNLPS